MLETQNKRLTRSNTVSRAGGMYTSRPVAFHLFQQGCSSRHRGSSKFPAPPHLYTFRHAGFGEGSNNGPARRHTCPAREKREAHQARKQCCRVAALGPAPPGLAGQQAGAATHHPAAEPARLTTNRAVSSQPTPVHQRLAAHQHGAARQRSPGAHLSADGRLAWWAATLGTWVLVLALLVTSRRPWPSHLLSQSRFLICNMEELTNGAPKALSKERELWAGVGFLSTSCHYPDPSSSCLLICQVETPTGTLQGLWWVPQGAGGPLPTGTAALRSRQSSELTARPEPPPHTQSLASCMPFGQRAHLFPGKSEWTQP